MIRTTYTLAAACLLSALLTGCTSYYAITDPSSGKTYYTTEHKVDEGALTFRDTITGSRVRIQNSEVAKITKDQYREATGQE